MPLELPQSQHDSGCISNGELTTKQYAETMEYKVYLRDATNLKHKHHDSESQNKMQFTSRKRPLPLITCLGFQIEFIYNQTVYVQLIDFVLNSYT